MPSAVTIQLIGADKLISGLNGSEVTVKTEAHRVMERSLLRIEGRARTLVPRKSGRLAGGISYRITGHGADLTGEVGPSARYGLYVEKGTKPHWMPPGILPFPAMRSIAKKGTKAYPYMLPAFEQSRGQIEQEFAAIGIKVVQAIVRG